MRTIIDECDYCRKIETNKTYAGYIDPIHMVSVRGKEYCNDCIDRMVRGFSESVEIDRKVENREKISI